MTTLLTTSSSPSSSVKPSSIVTEPDFFPSVSDVISSGNVDQCFDHSTCLFLCARTGLHEDCAKLLDGMCDYHIYLK